MPSPLDDFESETPPPAAGAWIRPPARALDQPLFASFDDHDDGGTIGYHVLERALWLLVGIGIGWIAALMAAKWMPV